MNKEIDALIHDNLEQDKLQVEGKPHGWIQWKGTDVCIDIHCECGELSHFDGDFLYAYKCPYCGKAYLVGQNVVLYPLTDGQVKLTTMHWFAPKQGEK